MQDFAHVAMVNNSDMTIVPGDRDRAQLFSVIVPQSAASPRQ
jgi:hypothetical protein